MNNILNKVTIVYCTCDKYECLWPGFFKLFEKYFQSYTGDIILNTEKKNFSYSNYNIRRPNFDMSDFPWSERMLESLKMVDTPYVIIWLDDFYLKKSVDLEILEQCVQIMDESSTVQLFTFGWQPGHNVDDGLHPKFERRSRFASYRVNAQIGLWRKKYLIKIINRNENPWQFELNGSFRSSLYGGDIYSLKRSSELVFDYDWGFLVIRGKLNSQIAGYFKENEGIEIDFPFGLIDGPQHPNHPGILKRISKKLGYLWGMISSLFK